jgi:xanthine dehydrogenase accessory factor
MSDPQIVARLDEALSLGESAVLCTLIEKQGSGPREPGSKMLVTADGGSLGTIGGGGMERLIVEQALEALREGRPRTLHFAMGVPPREDMISIDSKCGGEVKIFMDVIRPEPRLFIFGSGWIAQAVARYAVDCDFEVTVVDDAPTARPDLFPQAKIISDSYPESLKEVAIRHSDYVAVLHGETPFEIAALSHAVKARPAYIGLLGSANKLKRHKEALVKEGLPQPDVERIKGPIGLEIEAETPEEIGVSIVAELIKVKRG